MRIGIIGGGAVGLLFAAYLQRRHSITLYTRSKEQAGLLEKKGLILEKEGRETVLPLSAKQAAEGIGDEELLIVAVKQYDLPELIPLLISRPDIPLLFLQNGCGHLEMMERLPHNRIYAGSVEHGALRLTGNHVVHTGEGVVKAGAFRGAVNESFPLIEAAVPGFPFCIEDNVREMLHGKLAVNAVINPLTAVLGAANGELLDNPEFYQLFIEYTKEVAELLSFPFGPLADRIEQVCRKTAANRSSMLKDIENGRQTEIEAITGYLLRMAERASRPARMSRMLYRMIKGLESRGGA